MILDDEEAHYDLFNQLIPLDARILASIHGRIKVCKVVKLNRKTIVVKEVTLKNGHEHRVVPDTTVLLSGEDLTILTLKGKI
jgi:hypothetical protein